MRFKTRAEQEVKKADHLAKIGELVVKCVYIRVFIQPSLNNLCFYLFVV